MPRARRSGAARYLAPAAFLAGVTIAVLLVHSALEGRTEATTQTTAPPSIVVSVSSKPPKHPKKRFYTVQSGDTFGTIAGKVGISVERLQALNPGVSSNALQVGQKLRIR